MQVSGVEELPLRCADSEKWDVVDLDWGRRVSAAELIAGCDCLLATTLIKELRVEELLELEEEVKVLRGGRGIDLVVPTMVNSHKRAGNETRYDGSARTLR